MSMRITYYKLSIKYFQLCDSTNNMTTIIIQKNSYLKLKNLLCVGLIKKKKNYNKTFNLS